MKIAHFCVITPNRCGLYETARETVKGLRDLGIDSRLVDPDKKNNKLHPNTDNDRGAAIASLLWAQTADLFVSHSGLGDFEKNSDQPIIHVAHGRPKSSFLSEKNGGIPVYSYAYKKNKDPRFKTVVTYWPEHEQYLRAIWPNTPIEVITAPVDLDLWKPEGRKHNFNGKGGVKNIIITDPPRDDIDSFDALNAFILYNRKYPGSKLHIYAMGKEKKGWGVLIQQIKDENGLGEVLPWVKGLDAVYRAADLTLTCNQIDTRTVRESMACGCPVLKVKDINPEEIRLKLQQDRREARKEAFNFDMKKTAKDFLRVIQNVH